MSHLSHSFSQTLREVAEKTLIPLARMTDANWDVERCPDETNETLIEENARANPCAEKDEKGDLSDV